MGWRRGKGGLLYRREGRGTVGAPDRAVAGCSIQNDGFCRNVFPSMVVPKPYYEQDGNPQGFIQDDLSADSWDLEHLHPWYVQLSAYGHNEVVVESPKHNLCIATYSPGHGHLFVQALVARGRELSAQPGVRYITLFKQHKCGSLVHPHSQFITTPFIPSLIEALTLRAFQFYRLHGGCSICSSGIGVPAERLVLETQRFVVWVPFAARSPHRLLIAPRTHGSCFFAIDEEEQEDLSLSLIHI
eukprot:TRINITY_DN43123_c0_g1_i3.p1 TRINITY_DN43123_c0_g1~~TRINITY_DN43123_c0_g1_i3.p1  ORF type:complete len:243 (+),score=46.54 TRINITY_DN43123_c0_g1_i3:327-1055(+)